MKDKLDVEALLIDVENIRKTILKRLMKFLGMGMNIRARWAMAGWLAKGAPDDLYEKISREIHHAWQADLARKKAEEAKNKPRLRLKLESQCTKSRAEKIEAKLSAGWRIASPSDIQRLIEEGHFAQYLLSQVFWIKENEKFILARLVDGQLVSLSEFDPNDCHRVFCVCEEFDIDIGSVDMGKVKCSGDPAWHKCEERKCPHRLPHSEINGCTRRVFNNSRTWCSAPGTKSMISLGEEEGGLVTCVPIVHKRMVVDLPEQAERLLGRDRGFDGPGWRH